MKEKKGFFFNTDFIAQIEAIRDPNIRVLFYKAVVEYGCHGISTDFLSIDPMGMLDSIFISIKQSIDNGEKKQKEISAVRAQAAKNRWLKSTSAEEQKR